MRRSNAVRTLYATILVLVILVAGCGSKSDSQTGVVSINPAELFADISTSIQQPVTRALDGWDWTSFISNFGSLLINFSNTIEMQKVIYQSTGADGKIHSMTGLLILPKAIIGGKPSVPILMYQHGTEVYRPFSPSQYLTHRNKPTDYPEVMVAAAIAATGYAVALVDYEGMGDNTDIQPHVNGAVLAQQVIDLLKSSRTIIAGTNSPCTWNSQLFLMGFSEGGYVTMAATRELQLNHAAEFTVTASAPLSGPHDLSGVMRGVILSDNEFKSPYFVPMILASYNYAYGGQTAFFSPDYAMLQPYNTSIPPLFNGNFQSDTISEAMGMTFSPVHLIVPKSTLTQQFIDQLTSDASPVVALLKQNDSYRLLVQPYSAWVPTVPMRMIHHKLDDLVPYENSQVAYDAFITAGASTTTVQLVQETFTINISSDPVKTVHVGSAFPELLDGWDWLNTFRQ
ncbi:MAG: lipase family protein [Geobacteraceae bacterium]|nr:lipase family protein [Geobacteraceae bacterium]